MSDRRVLLGVVGVDSGQLIVADPCYLNSEWEQETGVDLAEVLYRDTETGSLFNRPMNWTLPYRNGMSYSEAYKSGLIVKHIPDELKEKMQKFSYSGCCNRTINDENQGGQLHYKMGHAGAGVVFSSGLGDGEYEVWATIGKVDGWGERVKKVEIILIDEEAEDE